MTNGILILDKPLGVTSHDAVNKLRRILGTRKIGHAGTLDPDASGVLVMCVGQATRLLEFLTLDEKAYDAVITFGAATDTDDASGEIIAQASAASLTESLIPQAVEHFTGEIEQQVPKYSAVHIQGQRAYDLARRGESFELPVRTVTIQSLILNEFTPGETAAAHVSVTCSKGTYIRSLARDLGTYLGVPAHLSGLRRTRSGPFRIEAAVTVDELSELAQPQDRMLPLEAGVAELAQFVVDATTIERITSGQTVEIREAVSADLDRPVAVMTKSGELAAIGMLVPGGNTVRFRPRKVFWKKESNDAAD